MNDNLNPVVKIEPFRRLCMTIGELPTSYLETMTYYEMLVWFTKFLGETVIPTVNNNAEAVSELQAKYIELKTYIDNYFDNLDVQEEINNKLDDMVEAGTLQEIIADYLNSKAIFGFDNVANMKASTNLIDGSYAETLGYYAKNDGGKSLYKIRTITNDDVVDEATIIALNDNTLIAELIIDENVNVNQFGAKGDGITNDTTAFNKAITKLDMVNLLNDKTYKLTSLTIEKDFIIHGNGAKLIDDTSVTYFIYSSVGTRHEIKFDNLKIDLSHSTYGIYFTHTRFKGDNIEIKGATTCNIDIIKGTTAGAYGWLELKNSRVEYSTTGLILNATDCYLDNIVSHNCMTHYEINSGLTHLHKIHGWNFNENSTDYITGSILIKANADIVGNDIFSDTLETAIQLPTVNYKCLLFNNVNIFLNTSSYPSTQNDPQLFSNLTEFQALNNVFCRINGLYFNGNNWRNSNNEYPVLVPEVNTPRIQVSNVGGSGVKYNNYRVIPIYGDIATTDITATVSEYISLSTRKYTKDQYSTKIYIRATLKKALAADTCISQVDFITSNFNYLDRKAIVDAYFHNTTTHEVYKLDGYISDDHSLYIYNHNGSLNGGDVIINIRWDKVVL
ncbi:MAG: hypothetical protein J6T10_08430 [Methanobrevibacter sp.]|nr:hypothetical protein [Methanobrevibacter sp.]